MHRGRPVARQGASEVEGIDLFALWCTSGCARAVAIQRLEAARAGTRGGGNDGEVGLDRLTRAVGPELGELIVRPHGGETLQVPEGTVVCGHAARDFTCVVSRTSGVDRGPQHDPTWYPDEDVGVAVERLGDGPTEPKDLLAIVDQVVIATANDLADDDVLTYLVAPAGINRRSGRVGASSGQTRRDDIRRFGDGCR